MVKGGQQLPTITQNFTMDISSLVYLYYKVTTNISYLQARKQISKPPKQISNLSAYLHMQMSCSC